MLPEARSNRNIDEYIAQETPERVNYLKSVQLRLLDKIKSAGRIPLSVWMNDLTEAYYAQADIERDFITPPEQFPNIGHCYAEYAFKIYKALESPEVFEVWECGAGNGRILESFLKHARELDSGFYKAVTYHIVERSSNLISKQKQQIEDTDGLMQRTVWHQSDVTEFKFPVIENGIVILMELDDALPPRGLLKINQKIVDEIYITEKNGVIREIAEPALPDIMEEIKRYPEWWEKVPDGYVLMPTSLESVRLREQLTRQIKRGAIITTDYGFMLPDYYFEYPRPDANPFPILYRQHSSLFTSDHMAHMYDIAGLVDVSAVVDFYHLSLPGQRLMWNSEFIRQQNFMEQNGFFDAVVNSLTGLSEEQKALSKRKIQNILGTRDTWSVLIQTKGFDNTFPVKNKPNSGIPGWLSEL
jgi:SAM-dependent MidA family methyltransferase